MALDDQTLGIMKNSYQGDYKKVLCVCSAGLLRSPTMAWVLSKSPFNFNTRSAGIDQQFALIPVTQLMLHWADEVVCADQEHAQYIKTMMSNRDEYVGQANKPIHCMHIPDIYDYRASSLVHRIKEAAAEIWKFQS